MKISIVGTGYVGLVTGACLADKGHSVTCVDLDREKVDRINRSEPPIFEAGLEELLDENVPDRLRATTNLPEAVRESTVTFIAVGTPFDGEEIDLSQVVGAAEEIGEALKDKKTYHVVVVKSTVVPGTTDERVLPALERASGRRAGRHFGVGVNPEFLREGVAVSDFMDPDRVVLGGIDRKTVEILQSVYDVFPRADALTTTTKTAEMIKYASNSLFATLISFSNEIASVCSKLGGIDVVDVMRGVHLDKRVSPLLPDHSRIVPGVTSYLEAGCGFGGSCFPKDVRALIAHGRKAGASMPLLGSVMEVNDRRPHRLVELVRKHYESLDRTRVAVLGLSFKPGTDDMRESPAIPVIRALQEAGAAVRAFDPAAKCEAEERFRGNGVALCDDMEDAVDGADAVILVTSWPEFRGLPALLEGRSAQPLVVDGRRMLDPKSVQRYEGIGLSEG